MQFYPIFLQDIISTTWTRDLLVTWRQFYQLREGSPSQLILVDSSKNYCYKSPSTRKGKRIDDHFYNQQHSISVAESEILTNGFKKIHKYHTWDLNRCFSNINDIQKILYVQKHFSFFLYLHSRTFQCFKVFAFEQKVSIFKTAFLSFV